MSEIVGIEQWLYETLHGDSGTGGVSTRVAGRIYVDEAPQGSVYPMVLISAQSVVDVFTVGPHRVMVNGLWWVRVVGQTASKKALEPIADRIDVLLQAAGGTTSYIRILIVTREQPLAGLPPVTANGVRYTQLGSTWRIQAQVPT